jgi:hypothetical protein
MLLNLSLKTAFVYGAFSLPVCIGMWLYVPETKGCVCRHVRTLNQS